MGLEEQVKILRRLTGGFQASRVLIAANNLGVFDNLKTPKDAETLATAIGTDKRATLRRLKNAGRPLTPKGGW